MRLSASCEELQGFDALVVPLEGEDIPNEILTGVWIPARISGGGIRAGDVGILEYCGDPRFCTFYVIPCQKTLNRDPEEIPQGWGSENNDQCVELTKDSEHGGH